LGTSPFVWASAVGGKIPEAADSNAIESSSGILQLSGIYLVLLLDLASFSPESGHNGIAALEFRFLDFYPLLNHNLDSCFAVIPLPEAKT